MKTRLKSSSLNNPGAKAAAALLLFFICFGLLSIGIHSLTKDNTLGSDFYVFYLAGKAIRHHENPYSIELAQEAQIGIYKRLAQPGEDELGFAYPPYALLPAAPLFLLPFEWAQAIWMALCILALISAVYYSAPKVPAWVLVSLLVFYPVSFGLILGNFAILVSAVLIGAFSAITAQQPQSRAVQLLWGILLAWAACKPQFSWLFIITLLLFSLRYHRRWIVISFFAGLAVFILFSFLILPGWPALWFAQAARYAQYNQTWLMLTFFAMQVLPLKGATLVSILLALACLPATFWLVKRWRYGAIDYLAIFAWAAFITFLFHPRGKSYEQIIYLIPIILWVCRLQARESWPVILFWFGNLLFFGVTFYLSLSPGRPPSLIEWPFLGFILWLAWLVLSPAPEPRHGSRPHRERV